MGHIPAPGSIRAGSCSRRTEHATLHEEGGPPALAQVPRSPHYLPELWSLAPIVELFPQPRNNRRNPSQVVPSGTEVNFSVVLEWSPEGALGETEVRWGGGRRLCTTLCPMGYTATPPRRQGRIKLEVHNRCSFGGFVVGVALLQWVRVLCMVDYALAMFATAGLHRSRSGRWSLPKSML